jgi:integrase
MEVLPSVSAAIRLVISTGMRVGEVLAGEIKNSAR